ncbi:MAG: amidohydrolase [Nitrospinae bacterium]|nr:amidohydrolase [Nitrospinota bacterium]
MTDELLIDIHAHVYQTPENGRLATEGCDRTLQWGGTIEELRSVMREAGIWRTVISVVTPTQAMREQALSQLPVALSHDAREKAEAEIRERMLQRMDHNNRWGCDVGREYPELVPFINVDPVLMDAITVRRKVRESVAIGARGITLVPSLHGFYGNDRRVWPIYEMAQSLGLSILAQTGDAGPRPPGGRDPWGRPRYFGEVAASFPKLTLILAHVGQGYESEIAALTRRHPKVYTDTSVRLTLLGKPGKWTPAEAVTWLRLIGVDRVLFGTMWPLFGPQQEIATVRNLPLTQEEKRKILGENARRVLQL